MITTSLTLSFLTLPLLIDTVTRCDWPTYEFKPNDFGTFERTAKCTKLAKDKNWLDEYDRATRGMNKNYLSFWLKKDQIHFIPIDPFAPPEWRMNSFVHEIAHMSLCEDATSKLIHRQLNYRLVKELRKKLDARADRGQLLTSAVHVIKFFRSYRTSRKRSLSNLLSKGMIFGTSHQI